ncbi:2OG-Fe(II) oxygenase family protein [Oceanibacterium hippocampi]|uniref:2-oxoglutarate-dependent ethylene/succinate-forming enzyme n=1 Tax=Oceanibacterium hippocampi TaxID=745714 RepID=A0A1Y5S377_9PROT|nr:2OG-Fe(II) oxygenase family protein [Oceanibacterium hippocampi]SLN30582.1 2OG-Fe(II) oxygenase superfamily protein [Oceanibacterium hippocampi]
MPQQIETIRVDALAGPPGPLRDATDTALGRAAEALGFLVITGAPVATLTEAGRRARLLRLFDLPAPEKRRLTNSKHAPENDNRYRGYYAYRRPGAPCLLEGLDMGGGDGPAAAADDIEALLMEHNVWPADALLPGWRAEAEAHYRDMEAFGHLLMASLARHLGLGGDYFEPFFGGGSSTLRFLQGLPPDLPEAAIDDRYRAADGGLLATPAHRDSGVLTLLWQPGGLEAQAPDGRRLAAPDIDGALNVNFGDCLEFWSGGRLRATPHRVRAQALPRQSVPFFFEPRFDALIAPMPGARPAPAIRYADHLIEKMRLFGTHATEPRSRNA